MVSSSCAVCFAEHPRTSRSTSTARGSGARYWIAAMNAGSIVSLASATSSGPSRLSGSCSRRWSGYGCNHPTSPLTCNSGRCVSTRAPKPCLSSDFRSLSRFMMCVTVSGSKTHHRMARLSLPDLGRAFHGPWCRTRAAAAGLDCLRRLHRSTSARLRHRRRPRGPHRAFAQSRGPSRDLGRERLADASWGWGGDRHPPRPRSGRARHVRLGGWKSSIPACSCWSGCWRPGSPSTSCIDCCTRTNDLARTDPGAD